MRRRPARFLRDASATSAIEFALLLPILITLGLGSIELQRYQRISRQLTATAENVAELIAQRETAQSDPLNFDFNIAVQLFPQAFIEGGGTYWWNKFSHQISHAQFVPTQASCVSNCTYKANLLWNWPVYNTGPGAGALRRTCGELTPQQPGETPTGQTLPAGLFGPGTTVMVDLRYSYKPLFGANFLKPIIIERQGYSFPRFASPYIKVTGSQITFCPGYV